jgi:hypothetical protein
MFNAGDIGKAIILALAIFALIGFGLGALVVWVL